MKKLILLSFIISPLFSSELDSKKHDCCFGYVELNAKNTDKLDLTELVYTPRFREDPRDFFVRKNYSHEEIKNLLSDIEQIAHWQECCGTVEAVGGSCCCLVGCALVGAGESIPEKFSIWAFPAFINGGYCIIDGVEKMIYNAKTFANKLRNIRNSM